MTELRIRAARFILSDGGLSGHLVFADDSRGSEVTSELEALIEVTKALREGKIVESEVPMLKKEIASSHIAETACSMTLLALHCAAKAIDDQRKIRHEHGPTGMIH